MPSPACMETANGDIIAVNKKRLQKHKKYIPGILAYEKIRKFWTLEARRDRSAKDWSVLESSYLPNSDNKQHSSSLAQSLSPHKGGRWRVARPIPELRGHYHDCSDFALLMLKYSLFGGGLSLVGCPMSSVYKRQFPISVCREVLLQTDRNVHHEGGRCGVGSVLVHPPTWQRLPGNPTTLHKQTWSAWLLLGSYLSSCTDAMSRSGLIRQASNGSCSKPNV